MIFIPHLFIHQPTWDALAGFDPVGVPMDADDAYLRYFEERWRVGVAFINIEHDVIVRHDQLLELYTCPNSWCCFPEYLDGPATLSIARFRSDFIACNRMIWADFRADHFIGEGGRQPAWTLLDAWLRDCADRIPCLHGPPYAVNARPIR